MSITDYIKKLAGLQTQQGRREARLRVRVPSVVNGVNGRLFDLSLRGCGFYAERANPDMDKKADISFSLRRGKTYKVKGKIVSQDEEGAVFGIVFTEVPDDAFDAIDDLLSRAKIRPNNIEL